MDICPKCKNPELLPVLTECGRFVDCDTCEKCGGSWWAQWPRTASADEKKRYANWASQQAGDKDG